MNTGTPTQSISIDSLNVIDENTRTAYSLIDMVRWHVQAAEYLSELHDRREIPMNGAEGEIFNNMPPVPGDIEARDISAVLYLASSLVRDARKAAETVTREVTT